MSGLDATRRSESLRLLEDGVFDLAIIGGGITGAGVACEAARRGLRVALLEAEDFAAGTSSRSSKLVHGGLRYLAMGDVALVRETALERKVLHRLAPHLAERRWMVLPVRSRAGLLKFRTAITTYEKLGAVEAEDLHRNWDVAELEHEEPALDRERFPYACAYREYLTDDARLVIANLRAADVGGAACVNYLRAVRLTVSDSGRIDGVEAVCALSGDQLRIRARAVVNAAGPWVEAVRRFEDPQAPSVLALSKGVHLCFPRDKLPIRNVLLLTAADRRTLFAIPRGQVTYVGTTDTAYDGGARVWPEVLAEDVGYILAPLAVHCPAYPLAAADVVAAWAGLRPLIAQPGKAVKDLSRKEEVTTGRGGLVSVAGGKLTGYRVMAARILEGVAEVLGRGAPAPAAPESPLPGGDFAGGTAATLESELIERRSISAAQARRLVGLYGTDAGAVLDLGQEPLVAGSDVVAGEVSWAISREAAVQVEDVVYRRTRAAWFDPVGRRELATAVAERMAETLGWDDQRCRDEIARTQSLMDAELAFAPD